MENKEHLGRLSSAEFLGQYRGGNTALNKKEWCKFFFCLLHMHKSKLSENKILLD